MAMLSPRAIAEIQRAASRYPDKRAACIDALRIVQRHHGWVSDAALTELAGLLAITPHELDSVATYYNLIFRRPVGRHTILLCDSVTCWMLGYEGLRAHLQTRYGVDFGQTTEDGRYTLLPVPCLGACDRAPAMLVDEDLHLDLTPPVLDEILARYE
jgi:NADH-quinone oxidoreductase subunit E